MTLWAVLAVMTVAALSMLLWPMLRRSKPPAPRAAHDVEVYRHQLAEIARDRERGLITEEELTAARLEIERRLLRAADEAAKTSPTPGFNQARSAMWVLVLVVPAASALLYLQFGAPELPDMPFAERQAERQVKGSELARAEAIRNMSPEQRAEMIRGMVGRLAKRLEDNPDDLAGWRRLARSYLVLGKPENAVQAYARAAALAPRDIAVLSDYAEALLGAHGGDDDLPEPFVAVMRDIRALDRNNALALWYLGLAAAQRGKPGQAMALWRRLLDILPADAPQRAELEKRIQSLPQGD